MFSYLFNAFYAVFFLRTVLFFVIYILGLLGIFLPEPYLLQFSFFNSLSVLSLLATFPAYFSTRKVPFLLYWPVFFVLAFSILRFYGLIPGVVLHPFADPWSAWPAIFVLVVNFYMRFQFTGNRYGFFPFSYFADRAAFPNLRFFLIMPLTGFFLLAAAVLGILALSIKDKADQSHGEFRIAWDGVHTRHSLYSKGEKKVHLIGMMHIGTREYYEKALALIPKTDCVVLAEGVTDKDKLLDDGISYEKLASVLGLESQNAHFQKELRDARTMIRADIDLSKLSENARAVIKQTMGILNGKMPDKDAKPIPPEAATEAFEKELLDLRNNKLMSVFEREEANYNCFVMPWGALHLSAISQRVIQHGYRELSHEELKVLSF